MKSSVGGIGLQFHIEKGSVAAPEMVAETAKLTMVLEQEEPGDSGSGTYLLHWIWQE